MMEGISCSIIVQLLLLIATTFCSPTRQQQETEVQHSISRHSLNLENAHDINNGTHISTATPLHYKLQLNPNLEVGTFQGKVKITFICTVDTNTVTLHADKALTITQTRLDVVDSTNLKSINIIGKNQDANNEWLVITLAEELLNEVHYQLTLNFNGKLQTEYGEGFVRGSYQHFITNDTRWFAGIHTSRSVFPCFNEPMFKTPFEISVAHKAGYMTLANTLLRVSEKEPQDDTLVWDHFIVTPPISIFSVGVFVSDFVSITPSEASNNTVALQVFGPPGKEPVLQTAANLALTLLTTIQDYLGMPYPFSKLDIVIAPQQTLAEVVDYAGVLVFLESELTDIFATHRLSIKLASQWLLHMTSPLPNSSLGDSTLVKFVTIASNAIVPKWEIQHFRSLLYHLTNNNVVGFEDQTTSGKAIWTLMMLNRTLSEQTFKRGLFHFLESRKYQSYTPDDLWTALDSAVSDNETDFSVSEIVRPWLEFKRIPVVTVTRNYDARSANIKQHVFIKKCPHNITANDIYTWDIPIMYITEDNLDLSTLRQVPLMREREITVTDLPEADKFIIVNPNGIGMFVVNYDQRNWAMIAQYLAENPTRMAVDTRDNLLHDAWNLGYAGELDFNSVLNMTLFLPKEPTLKVWDNFLTMEDHLGRHLDGSQAGKKFNEYCVLLLTNLLASLDGFKHQHNEYIAKLRAVAKNNLSWLTNVTYEENAGTYMQWINNMDPSEEISHTNRSVVCVIAKWGSNDEWDLCMNKLLTSAANAIPEWRLSIISRLAACSRKDEHFQRFLKAIFLENADLFTDLDKEIAIIQLTGTYGGIKGMLTFIAENWDAVKHSLENKPDIWKHLIREGTELFKTANDFTKVFQLYINRKEEFGIAKEIIETAIVKVGKEVEWSNRNHPVIEAWLDHKLAEMRN